MLGACSLEEGDRDEPGLVLHRAAPCPFSVDYGVCDQPAGVVSAEQKVSAGLGQERDAVGAAVLELGVYVC